MNRRKTTKKVLVSPQLQNREYALLHPYAEQGLIYNARLAAVQRLAQEEAEAQAEKQQEDAKKAKAEAKKKSFEDAKKASIEHTEQEAKVKQNDKSDEIISDKTNESLASVQLDKNLKSIYDYLDEENGRINQHFFKPVEIEDPSDYNYIVDPASQSYNTKQKNTAEAAADREIQRLYGDSINRYNERLRRAEEYDTTTNQQIDQRNQDRMASGDLNIANYEQHVDTASRVKEEWENSEEFQKIQQTKDYILQNYVPNEALANKVQDYGTSEYNPVYAGIRSGGQARAAYDKAKLEYDNALKLANDRTIPEGASFFDEATQEEFRRRNELLLLKNLQLIAAEKALVGNLQSLSDYEYNLNALSNLIRTQGLPENYKNLTKFSQYTINKLGLMDVLYTPDGSLNKEFVGVGYATDKEINEAAKNAAEYFKSSEFKSGLDVPEDYIADIKEDIDFKREIYKRLSLSDKDQNLRTQYNINFANLSRAKNIIEKAERHKYLNDVVKRADGFFTKQTAKNIGYGVLETLRDPGFWTLGIGDLIDSEKALSVAEKINSGKKLTESEKVLASSLAIESVMHQNYQDYEKTGGFIAGKVATESLKFMAEMAATSGTARLMTAPGRAAMKAAANKYIRKFGADGFKNILGRNLAKTPGLLKVIGGDTMYSLYLANTLLLPATVAEVNRLETGNIVPGVDEDGNLTIAGYEDAKSPLNAWYEAEARAFTENMSEMIGEYGIGAFLKYPFKYFGKLAIKNSDALLGAFIKGSSFVDDALQLINKMLPTKTISSFIKPVGSFIKAGHYSGIVGETAEEYYGNAMLHLLGVSDGTKIVTDENGNEKTVKTSFWEEINPTTELGKQTFFDIVGGIALSTGFLGAGSMLNYARIAHDYDKSRQRLVDYIGKDTVDKMEDALSQANSANIAATANTIIKGISRARDREAFIDFYENMMRFHGASLADQKLRESTDLTTYERAKRDAEANGYSIQYNSLRADLQRAIDSLRLYAEGLLGTDDGQLDETIESNGGAAEFIQYLSDTGNPEMASTVMAYNNAKTQYEASMRRLMDDIDEDLANNEKWINRLSNNAGKVVVGTTKEGGYKVYVKSGTHIVDGKIKAEGKTVTVVNQDGSVEKMDSDQLKDEFEEIDANELKHDLDVETYTQASLGFDMSNTSQKIGVLIQMSKGRIGTIINKTADGRIMYSVNDLSTNTEVMRITDPGVTEEDLIKRWADSYNEEFKNNEIKKAKQQLNSKFDRTAQIVATNELREYIKSVKEKERQDMKSLHGKAIKYANGVLTPGSVDKVIDDIESLNGMFMAPYVNVFNKAGVSVDASNWKRLGRLIIAFKKGNLTRKQLKEILCDGSTNMSNSAKEDLLNISVDSHGNVTWWKDQDDTNASTHVDTNEYDLSEETLEESEKIIEKSISDENRRLNLRDERKKRGEAGRKVAKQKRAEKKKTRKQILAEKTKLNAANVPQKVNEQISKHSEPAPEPTPADITTFVVKEALFPNLKNSLEKLNKQAEWTDANVLRDQTTSHNYFIMIDGKRVMFTRVHGILDKQYENVARDAKLNTAIEDLADAYNKKGIDGLKAEISKALGENKKRESDIYIGYLEENPEEYKEVIEGVANVAISKNSDEFAASDKSIVYGNYIDELCRKFFNGEQITTEYIFENGTPIKDLMKVAVSEEEKKKGIKSTLETFIDLCKNIKTIYDALGWELVPEKAVFTYQAYDEKLGRNVRIAGETDMIAVDRLGNYHIIDFKTSYKNFEDYIENGSVVNKFESVRKDLTVDKSKLVRSTKEYYTDQQTMYSVIVESTLEGNVDSIEILPFKLSYDNWLPRIWFDDIDNTKVVLSNDKSFQYDIKVPQRIMLTKNGKLINRFSEKHNEKEIAAKNKLIDAINSLSNVELQSEVDNLPQDQKEDVRNRTNAINDRIKKIVEASGLVSTEEEYNKLIEQVNGIKLELEDLLNYVQQKITDNEKAIADSIRLRKQKEAELQSHDAWIQQQASAQTKWSADWKAAFERDYQQLKNLCTYIDKWAKEHNNNYSVQPGLMQQFNQLISNLRFAIEFDNEVLGTTSGRIISLDSETIEKVNKIIDWVTGHVNEYTPVPPVTPPTTIDEYSEPTEAWKQTNGLFKDPYKESNGVSSSVAIDDHTLKLSDATKNVDFVDNSEFRVLSNNGKLFILITYGGHTYTPVAFYYAETKEGKMLKNRMIYALKYAGSNQKVIITGGIKRSFGTFIVKQEGQYKTAHEHGMIALKDGEPGIDIYDIEYSATQHHIGITYTKDVQNGANSVPITEVRVPQEESTARAKFERQKQDAGWVTDRTTGAKRRMVPDSPYALSFGSAIYTYSNANDRKPKSSGIFVFMHNLGYTDDPKCSVPVTMRHSYISENDADFIVDALLGEYNGLVKRRTIAASQNNPLGFSTSTELVKGFGGNVVIGGQTIDVSIADILDMLIPVKGCPSYEALASRQDPTLKMPVYLDLDNVNETGEVLVIGNIEGDGIELKLRSYNIKTNEGIRDFKNHLLKIERNMNMNGFAQMRLGNIGAKTDQYGYPIPLSNNPTGGVTLKEYIRQHGELRFGKSCIKFDKNDFSNPSVQGDTNGISGMGWYLKNGFLECMYNGTEDPLIRIENDALVSTVDDVVVHPLSQQTTVKQQEVIKQSIENSTALTLPQDINSILWQDLELRNSDSSYSPDDFGFTKTLQQKNPNNPIDKNKALANLERILGSSVPVKFQPTVIAAAKCGASVVGLCDADGILLSEAAEAGVEYHEAFHRVMELLFTPELRQKAYNKFRKAKEGRQNLTDKQIAEIFADEFMYYAMNEPTIKLHWNVLKTFNEIKEWCGMWKKIGSYNLFRMYAAINSGEYADVQPDERSKELFLKYTNGKGYAYTTNGHNFEHIINGVHYKKLLNFIAMSFLHPSIQKVNLDGSNFDRLRFEKDLLIKKQPTIKTEEREYIGKDGKVYTGLVDTESHVEEDTSILLPINFFTEWMTNAPESTRLALQEMLDNFDAIEQDLAAYISLFATDYKIKYEQDNYSKKEGVDTTGGQFDDNDPTTSEEDIYDSWLDNHTKASYEFAPITRMTEKTKFFFSCIVKKKLTDKGWCFELNELGLPEMFDANYAFITVLNEVSDCKSIPEMYSKMTKLGEHDPLFNTVAARFGNLWKKVLNNEANADELGLVVLIFTLLKSTTNEFMLAKGIHKKNGEYDVVLEKTDQSYNAQKYVNDWAQSFAIGGCKFFRQTEDGSYKMNGDFDATVFGTVVRLMDAIQSNVVKGVYKTIDEIDKAKRQYLFYINSLGIPFTKEMLDKHLWSLYGDVGAKGLKTFFEVNGNSIDAFYKKINSLNLHGQLNITEDGKVGVGDRLPLDRHFAKDNFLTTLANAKYAWHRAHDQMSVLIANNKKAYAKSENNLITDRLNEVMYDEEAQRLLMSDVFNYNAKDNTGSIMLKNRGTSLRFVTMGGFKTDEYGNSGVDYLLQSKREDYIGKAIALLDGHILSPTLSDKKTWGFIAGLEEKMSEFGYSKMTSQDFFDSLVIDEEGNVKDFYIPDTVVNQLLEYAECENNSIKHILSQFSTDANGNRKWLIPENHLVDNFHKSKLWIKDGKVYNKKGKAPKDAIEVNPVQGARYTSLLGVYQGDKFVEFNQILDENGNYKDELANYNTAQQVFFSKSIPEKQLMIREVLLLTVRKELQAVEDLGLIRRKAVDSNTKDVLFTYENVGLPSSRLHQIEDKIISGKTNLTIAQKQTYKSFAIVAFIADVTNRHIISMQEFDRLFSGNPSFFKFGYDSKGHLIDRTVDQSKRLGGLVSTGTNNCLDIPGFPKEYRCVEVDNPMMEAAHIDKIKEYIYTDELRSGYLRYLLEQNGISYDDELDDSVIPTDKKLTAKSIADNVDNMTVEEIEKAMEGMLLLDTLKATAKAKAKKFEDVDIADGAAYVTDEMCENLLKMVGSWNKEIELAFKILRGQEINPKTGKPYTVSDTRSTNAYNKIITTVIGAQKYTAYGYRFQDGLAVPYYNKMALFPLFKNMCTGDMAKLYKAAKEQNIDMIMINSAVKVGSQSKYKIENWDNLELAKNAYTQKYSYLRKQFNTDPKEQALMAIKTQMMKVVMAAMIPGRSYTINGEEKSATLVRDDIMDALNHLSDIGTKELMDKFFKDGKFDIESFSRILREELSSRGATKELLDGCEVKDGEMDLTLDAMSGMNWIQSILISMINRKVIDVNAPGNAFYQRSVWGMEGKTTVLGDDDLPPSINEGNKLEVLNNVGSMDCVLSIDFFAEILKGTKAEHADFESQRKYLIRKGIIGPNAKANMIGYRVPTQAISSIHALRCVDVLPTVRHAIILPAEFTTITGSDYDIDKIFITMKHYLRIVDDSRSTKKEVHHITTDVFDKEKDPEKHYCNRLIDYQLALLTDKRVFNLLNGPIDNDTELLTSIVDDLEENESPSTLESYGVSTLSFQNNVRDNFVTGKVGIGPFALNNNNHILTMLYGIKFNEGFSEILDILGLRNLSSSMDRDNKSIMSWLSGLINLHVDNAKDPKISKLNVNPYTYNLVNLLVRTGLGKTTFYFTTQPIMKQLASVYNTASGVYMIEEGLSKTLAQDKAIDNAIIEYVLSNTDKSYKKAEAAIDDFSKTFKKDHDISTADAIKILFSKDCNVLHDISKGGSVKDLKNKKDELYSLNENLKLSFYEILMLVIVANKEFKEPAEKLSDLVKFSKIDTKKHGKNISELRSYLRGVQKTFNSDEATATFENIDKMYRSSYIKTKTDNAINTFLSIFGNVSIAATEQFDSILLGFLSKNEYAARNAGTITKIAKSILAQIKARFFFDVDNGYCKTNRVLYKGLVDGKDCVYNKLLRIKSYIMSQPEYAEYRDRAGNPINYLLQVLTSGYTTDVPNGAFDTAKFVLIASITQSDEINPQEMITALDNLLHDNQHPELLEFAKELIVYAFFTSADNGGNKDLFKYTPNSWKHESGYADWMKMVFESFKDGSYPWTEDDIMDVCLNNVDDNFFVHTAKKEKFTAIDHSGILAGVRITKQYRLIDGKSTIVPEIKFAYTSLADSPKYIKIVEGSDADGSTVTKVYVRTDVGMINGTLYPIYSQVNPRKALFKAGNYTYGYGTRVLPESSTELMLFKLEALKQALVVGIAVRNDGTATAYATENYELAIRDSIVAYNKFEEAQESTSVQEPIFIPERHTDYGEGWINHSGGAIGSDSYWGAIGETYGVKSNHYYHGQKTPNGNIEISDQEFEEGKQHVYKANETLNRKPDRYMDLLARNYMLVKNADAIFAIGHLRNGIVDGGTGWAVQMAIDDNKPVYVYDQERLKWYKNIDGKWSESDVPTLTKNFAGIGTRQINEHGIKAIEDVYKKTFVAPSENTTINIYAGTGENDDLSNFAVRPFEVNGIGFQSVEQGFQYSKFDALKQVINSGYTERDAAYNDVIQKIEKIQQQLLDTKRSSFNTDKDFGARLKSIGGTRITANGSDLQMIINNFFAKDKVDGFVNWEKGTTASNAMKMLIKASFRDAQNSQALQRLLATGNATLTHTQDKGKWGTEFPRLLMEVRDELREQQLSTNSVLQSTLGTKLQPLLVYSDGSDIKGTGNIGYGVVFEYNGQLFGISGTENGEEVLRLKLLFPSAKFSNPTMEMLALTSVLEHIAQSGIGEHIEINQDYKGAVNYNGLWYHSEGSDQREPKPWKAKEPYIAHLVERCETAIKQIEQNGGSVKIRWVKGHLTGNSEQARMNNAADAFAKNRSDFNTISNAYKQNNTFDDSDQPDDALKRCTEQKN